MTDTSNTEAISRGRGRGPGRGCGCGRGSALLSVLASLCVFVWLANSAGVISSNDGSHLALARALLRGQTELGEDRALTLEVDLAEHDGRAYSDRPPGTAFAALPAVWIGSRLDPAMRTRAVAQARAGQVVDPLPGARPYLATYAKRAGPGSTKLVDLIGTSLAICVHAALVGVLGLVLIDALLRALGWAAGSRYFALACLGLASAWGPYASALFSHVSAATGVAGCLLGIVTLARAQPGRRDRSVALATGLAGAWAIACDYSLLLAIVPAVALAVDRRHFAWVLLGTTPIVLATLAYHHAAFGSVFALGYDHQSNFSFARARDSTFSGDLFDGLWTLWGLGRGAGLLAQAPIVLLGLLACPLGADRTLRRCLLAFVPWVLLLGLHRTPWGGGTEDHRYLIPLLPFAVIGLAAVWARARTLVRVGLLGLAGLSCVLIWSHFLAWHEATPFDRPLLGLLGAALAIAAVLLCRKPLCRNHCAGN
jgi:hypothetical protein